MGARDELDRAARKQRDKIAATDDKAARVTRDREARRLTVRTRMRDEALAAGAGNRVLNLAILIGLVVPMGLSVWLLRDDFGGAQLAIAVGATALGVVVMVVLARVAERTLARLHLDRLRARAPGLDIARYQEQLSEKRRGATIRLTVHFARSWDDADAAKATDALKTWLPKTRTTELRGSTLDIVSEPLETTEYLAGGTASGGRFFNNRALHDWTSKAIARTVPKLAAIMPVTGVEVDIVGSVEDWDAEA